MKANIYECRILEKNTIAPETVEMFLEGKYIAEAAKPGQFVNIKCTTEASDLLLRRPISICDAYPDKGIFRLVYQIRGKGTKRLNKFFQVGNTVNVMGPLGNSFTIDEKYENVILAGGGLGVFPMLFLAKRSKAKHITACLGFKNEKMVVLKDELEKIATEVKIATDDGSYGHRGYVTELVLESIKDNTDLIYTCGPKRMMAKIQNMSIHRNIKAQFSLEERMGCGIGACLVCACKINKKDSDDYEYSHVCKDGPVFWGDEVIFDEW